jgi:hypothetical protein
MTELGEDETWPPARLMRGSQPHYGPPAASRRFCGRDSRKPQ